MSFILLPSALRATPVSRQINPRSFHASSTCRASILFALSSLSNSRETQHFNKLTRLSRVEHSPPLKLIQSSEVDPFPLPDPPPPKQIPLVPRPIGTSGSALRIWDDKALKVGRVVLANQARQTHRLYRALGRAKRREAQQYKLLRRDEFAWQQETQKLRSDMRVAGLWILLSIGTATVLATWRFWPDRSQADSGDLSRKIAARAAVSMPLPRAVAVEAPTTALASVQSAPMSPPAKPAKASPTRSSAREPAPANSSWWKGLFWKQHP